MAVDFAIGCSLVRPGMPRYPLLVYRAATLLHASFRPRLATTPLRFANPSPPSGWIKDFFLQAVDHARHTAKGRSFVPARRTSIASRAGAVKAGRRAWLAAGSGVARLRLDRAEHGARIKRVGRRLHRRSSSARRRVL